MKKHDVSRRVDGRASLGLLGILLVGIGIVIGVVAVSEFGWMPFGHAVPEAPVARPAPSPSLVADLPPGPGVNGQSFVQIAKAVKPAVVNVFSTRTGRGEAPHAMPFEDPFFRRFF
ncbi:MAG: hypothetical protein NZM29_03480, partial [Nitrospira sp.]|nr:hypothetical protein [Nitrospira sp.]